MSATANLKAIIEVNGIRLQFWAHFAYFIVELTRLWQSDYCCHIAQSVCFVEPLVIQHFLQPLGFTNNDKELCKNPHYNSDILETNNPELTIYILWKMQFA